MHDWIFLVEVFGGRCRKCFLASVSHTRTLQLTGTEKLMPLLITHENRKKVEYNDRVLQVEHASFTPLIFATNVPMGEEAERYHAILAEKMNEKLNCTYADTMDYIRKKLSFTILKTALIALRGHRKKQQYTSCSTRDTDINILCHNQ